MNQQNTKDFKTNKVIPRLLAKIRINMEKNSQRSVRELQSIVFRVQKFPRENRKGTSKGGRFRRIKKGLKRTNEAILAKHQSHPGGGSEMNPVH